MGVTSSDVYNKITTLMIWKTDFFQFCLYVCWGQGGRRRGAGHKGQNSSNEGNVNLSKRENKGLTWAVAVETEWKGRQILRRWSKRKPSDTDGYWE